MHRENKSDINSDNFLYAILSIICIHSAIITRDNKVLLRK